ncbi:MocR-like pyridoxine biosynthesis transcription factor PdxR [Acidicapsa acidisoli]|uniref:MocR-like pyridoxine biosynthesis transcription factor PdxR n=1 Tax=Acidicapsa acidisoli TaxID=1615681 RepID=UPI0021E034B2|nr:PLP-dependent aminotransferase family protein [Acidicapsa acidisoli]
MNRTASGILPAIAVDRKSPSPLHKQIYDGFRSAILRRELRPGQRIPSSRELSVELRVSRFPVLNAYAQLLAEGYFESTVGSGTFVSSSLPEQRMSVLLPKASVQKPSGPRSVARGSLLYPAFDNHPAVRGWGAFGVHQPALDQFPFQLWSSLVARHSRNPHANAIHHINPLGTDRFREAIADYLRAARGVKCESNQIMVVSGSQQALDITARVLFDRGDPVWVEEPGYRLQRSVLMAAGCVPVPIPVDNEGMNVPAGIRARRKARAAFVTPSHQYPLGVTMSASRRLQLLNWAQSVGAWIIEDDYDSEYRYESLPIASLHGLDVNQRVIYIGTFSKVLFPSLRLGYIVIPPDLVERFVSVRHVMDIFPPYLYQEVLSDFINEGHFTRHIRRMRQTYGEKRTALVESLKAEFGHELEIHGAEAGMHLTMTLQSGLRDTEIAARAARERLWLWPLSPSYLGEKHQNGFILGFGSIPRDQIPGNVRRLRAIISSK